MGDITTDANAYLREYKYSGISGDAHDVLKGKDTYSNVIKGLGRNEIEALIIQICKNHPFYDQHEGEDFTHDVVTAFKKSPEFDRLKTSAVGVWTELVKKNQDTADEVKAVALQVLAKDLSYEDGADKVGKIIGDTNQQEKALDLSLFYNADKDFSFVGFTYRGGGMGGDSHLWYGSNLDTLEAYKQSEDYKDLRTGSQQTLKNAPTTQTKDTVEKTTKNNGSANKAQASKTTAHKVETPADDKGDTWHPPLKLRDNFKVAAVNKGDTWHPPLKLPEDFKVAASKASAPITLNTKEDYKNATTDVQAIYKALAYGDAVKYGALDPNQIDGIDGTKTDGATEQYAKIFGLSEIQTQSTRAGKEAIAYAHDDIKKRLTDTKFLETLKAGVENLEADGGEHQKKAITALCGIFDCDPSSADLLAKIDHSISALSPPEKTANSWQTGGENTWSLDR